MAKRKKTKSSNISTKNRCNIGRSLIFMLFGFSAATLSKNLASPGQELWNGNGLNEYVLISEGLLGGTAAGLASYLIGDKNDNDVKAAIFGVAGAIALTFISDIFKAPYFNTYSGSNYNTAISDNSYNALSPDPSIPDNQYTTGQYSITGSGLQL